MLFERECICWQRVNHRLNHHPVTLAAKKSAGDGRARNSNGCRLQDDDGQLLHRFCQSKCPEAFQELVRRHIGWIESLVLRHVRDRHLAEDVTQAVFIILARKAPSIPLGTQLSAWLFRVARYASNDAVKHESRRQRRMERIAEMQTTAQRHGVDVTGIKENPEVIGGELDDALACLSDSDRQAILLRFYEDQSMAEIAVVLNISEDAAKQRISRAIKRLRMILTRKGVRTASVAAILTLFEQSVKMARAATVTKAGAIVEFTKVAAGQTDAAGRSLRVAQSAMKSIAGAQVRLWTAVAGATLAMALVVGVLTPVLGQIVEPAFDAIQMSLAWSQPSVDPDALPADPEKETARESGIARLWVGSSNVKAWPILPRSAPVVPLPLRTFSGSDVPVAIAQDGQGALWYRKVDSQLLARLADSDARYKDYDELNPYKSIVAQSELNDLLAPPTFTAHHFSAADDSGWQPVEPPSQVGVVVLPFAGVNPTGNTLNDPTNAQPVPEPSFLGAGLFGIAILVGRKRRSVHSRV